MLQRLHTPGRRRLRRPHLLLALTAALFLAGLHAPPATADLDVVFALDTTGSMSGEIREVQQRVQQLAVSIAKARDGERIRFGIVAYRDRGDEYITRLSPLTEDIETSRVFLESLRADGGGDGPESVVAALAVALRDMEWDRSDSTERQIFLIGDAPPHLDYGDEPTPEELIEQARRTRIVIQTIGCRSLPAQGIAFFRRMAYGTEGSYQHIGRVRAAQPGALTEALDRTVTSTGAGVPHGGEPLPITWLHHEEIPPGAPGPRGILVRQGGPEGAGQGADGGDFLPCSLEVHLPAGLDLTADPTTRLGPDGLTVELALGPGEGGLHRFSMATCPPLATPIHVLHGGA